MCPLKFRRLSHNFQEDVSTKTLFNQAQNENTHKILEQKDTHIGLTNHSDKARIALLYVKSGECTGTNFYASGHSAAGGEHYYSLMYTRLLAACQVICIMVQASKWWA